MQLADFLVSWKRLRQYSGHVEHRARKRKINCVSFFFCRNWKPWKSNGIAKRVNWPRLLADCKKKIDEFRSKPKARSTTMATLRATNCAKQTQPQTCWMHPIFRKCNDYVAKWRSNATTWSVEIKKSKRRITKSKMYVLPENEFRGMNLENSNFSFLVLFLVDNSIGSIA